MPTPPELVEKMLDMAKVTPQDFVIDLGSGDGRNVIAAAKRGARALGVEYNPDMVELSRRAARRGRRRRQGDVRAGRHVRGRHLEGHGDGAVPAAGQSRQAHGQVPRAQARHAHRPQHVRYRRLGARRDRDRSSGDCRRWCTAMLYIVPAQRRRHVEAAAGRADARRRSSRCSRARSSPAARSTPIAERAACAAIRSRSTSAARRYTGRVTGDRMEGMAGQTRWAATKIK